MICLNEMTGLVRSACGGWGGLLFFKRSGTSDSTAPAEYRSAAFSSHPGQKTAFAFLFNLTCTMIFHSLSLYYFQQQ
jgi:hypothetical protein